MIEKIFQGKVFHHRLLPKEHLFHYSVCYYLLNLKNPNPLVHIPFLQKFDPKNYLQANELKKIIEEKEGHEVSGEIDSYFVLTQVSALGYSFNPVSFYLAYSRDQLRFVISEITNTPWGEKHVNCFKLESDKSKFKFRKDFHVSPFMPMELNYEWDFEINQDRVHIQMLNHSLESENKFFKAGLELEAKTLNRINVYTSFLRYPLMPIMTFLRIYKHALFLYLKNIPFYTHPKKRGAL